MDSTIQLGLRRINGVPVTAETQNFNVGQMIICLQLKERASATRVTTTATIVYPNHGLATGDSIVVNGDAPFAGTFTVTVQNRDKFTYTVLNSGATSDDITVNRSIIKYNEFAGAGSNPVDLTISGTLAALALLVPVGFAFVGTVVNGLPNGVQTTNDKTIANATSAVIFTNYIVKATAKLGDTITITDIDRSGTTATATAASHGLETGQYITVDASNNALDGTYPVTVTNANVFTYTTETSGTISNATGTATTNQAELTEYNWGATNRVYTLNESYPYVQEILSETNDTEWSIGTGITAFAGGGQANATRLTKEYNNVTVVATADDSVLLEDLVAGQAQTIKNNGASNLAVFPYGTRTIDGGSASAAITMAPGTTRTFVAINTTDYESNQAISVNGTVFTSTTGITAFATGGQASATALTTYYNNVTTCATAGDSVKLLTAAAATIQIVKNGGATALDVFPFLGDTINGGSANAAIRIQPGATVQFSAIDGTDWKTNNVTLNVLGDIIGAKEVDHVVTVAATETAATVGGKVTIKGGAGATSGTGGAAEVVGGTAGVTAGATGGAVNITGGAEGAGGGITGAVNITTPNATGGAAGNINITPGTSSSTTVAPATILSKAFIRKPASSTVASGATITGVELVKGLIAATGATGNWQLPTAAQITTAIGATPAGTWFDFLFNAAAMTATNTATLVVGTNMTVMSAPAITGGGTLTVTQDTQVVGHFRITYDTATTCKISRIA